MLNINYTQIRAPPGTVSQGGEEETYLGSEEGGHYTLKGHIEATGLWSCFSEMLRQGFGTGG